jgi:D-alanyl-D-alanine carboxypeptidase/D-alanyl-D-alanine-endopeptidase (penicillin-binding protein 4)
MNGVSITGMVKTGKVPPGAQTLMTFLSPSTIEDAVGQMLEFSNNFVANQLFLATGARELGPPANLDKSLKIVKTLAFEVLGLTSLKIVEGSGISRENRITASDMLKLLRHFAPYRHMLKRELGIACKTGTLTGIRTRAGYLEPVPGEPHPFALFITENIENTDKIVRCLGRTADNLIGSGNTP